MSGSGHFFKAAMTGSFCSDRRQGSITVANQSVIGGEVEHLQKKETEASISTYRRSRSFGREFNHMYPPFGSSVCTCTLLRLNTAPSLKRNAFTLHHYRVCQPSSTLILYVVEQVIERNYPHTQPHSLFLASPFRPSTPE